MDEFENTVAEKQLILDGWGSNISLIVTLWTNGRPYINENLGSVLSLLSPTNKSYFSIKKKVESKRRIFIKLFNLSPS